MDMVFKMEAENSIFVETFGESPFIKTLDFFLTYDSFDYSKSQVAEETGISRVTLETIWQKFIFEGFIIKTRIIGRAEMYKLNKDNKRVKVLMDIALKLSSAFADEEHENIKLKPSAR